MGALFSKKINAPAVEGIPQKLLLIDARNRPFLERRAQFIALPIAAMAATVLLAVIAIGAGVLLLVDGTQREQFMSEAAQVTASVVGRRIESHTCGEDGHRTCENHFMEVRYRVPEREQAVTREVRVREETYRSRPSTLTLYYNVANPDEIILDGELHQGANILAAVTCVGAIFTLIMGGAAASRVYHARRFSRHGTLHYAPVNGVAIEYVNAEHTPVIRFTLPSGSQREVIDAKLHAQLGKRKDLTDYKLAVLTLADGAFKVL